MAANLPTVIRSGILSSTLHHAVSRLLTFEPPRRWGLVIVLVAVLVFVTPLVWLALRQPRLGDQDVVRIGLLILNRYGLDHFPRDPAMQVGDWWPGYTPFYLVILGAGYRLVGDLGLVFTALTAGAYTSLLIGFFRLGRKLALPFVMALLLAYMSGLYMVTGHGLAWTGVGNEMATPRNLYLALFPWLLLYALRAYLEDRASKWRWLLFGLLVGFTGFLHPLSSATVISIVALLLAGGVISRQVKPRDLAAFVLGTIPGVLGTYLSMSNILYVVTDPNINTLGPQFVYFSTARANVISWRLPEWGIPILVYTFFTLTSGGWVLLAAWRRSVRPLWAWLVFGWAQFGALLLILLIDWWVVFVAIEWTRRALTRQETRMETLTMSFLSANAWLALTVSAVFSLLGMTPLLPDGFGFARAFQRGGTLGYAGLIVLTALLLWRLLREQPQPGWFLVTVITTCVAGLHQPEFERLPGPWLPFDLWTYGGVLLLTLWHKLERPAWQPIRDSAVTMIGFEAIMRLLAIYPLPVLTLWIGLVALIAVLMTRWPWPGSALRAITLMLAGALIMAALLLPVGGPSTLSQLKSKTVLALQRNWSRIDTNSYYSLVHPAGEWLRANSAPDSLVVSSVTELRYWSLRSQIGGFTDHYFLYDYTDVYPLMVDELRRARAAYSNADSLLTYSRSVGADYVVVRDEQGAITLPTDQATEVFRQGFVIYRLNRE